MAQNLPYLPSNKNVGKLFEKIATAQKPDAFTHAYLRDTLGLKGTNDRPLISFLRSLGFLDAGNRATPTYDLLKNPAKAKGAIADGIKLAYGPLFKANERANQAPSEELRGLISQVTGADKDMVDRVAHTFSAILKQADFASISQPSEGGESRGQNSDEISEKETSEDSERAATGFRPEFHYNIQIHLPANGTEEAYLNIFNALRRTFK